nr:fimbria/pilus outer membrane usher protein [uncultured Enterobacter sp.]
MMKTAEPQDPKGLTLRRLMISISMQFILGWSPVAFSEEYFNPAFLDGVDNGQATPDLSIFEKQNTQTEGKYYVDILLNRKKVDSKDVNFSYAVNSVDRHQLVPCLSVDDLKRYGVTTEQFPKLAENSQCADLQAIPDAKFDFDFSHQQLNLSIPQAAMAQNPRGYVEPQAWDNGINALLLNYTFSGSNSRQDNTGSDKQTSSDYYLNMQPGVNLGAWRLRNYSTWNYSSQNKQQKANWSSVYTYVQRNIVALKSQLTLGESSSPSEVFDSINFSGAQLESDDSMQPDSMQGYAPTIHGIARTNAQVIVKQDDYTIYQTYVSAGAFEINDMYPSGSNGDFHVTVKESDGSEQNFIVPYASLAIMQREGHYKYSFTAGEYRPYDDAVDHSAFAQATLIYGLPYEMTLYGGTQIAGDKYHSLALGMGKNLQYLGAFSFDVTRSDAYIPERQQRETGQSYRFRYSKNFVETGTNFTFASYRYATQNFYTLDDALDRYRSDELSAEDNDRQRNRFDVTLNQDLSDDFGSVYATYMQENYWNSKNTSRSVSLGYNNSWKGISYSLSYAYSRNNYAEENNAEENNAESYEEKDQVFSLYVSIPLDGWLKNSRAGYSLNSSKQGNTTQQVNLAGTALEQRNLNWSLQENYTDHGVGNSGNLNLNYAGAKGETTVGYSYDSSQKRVNYGHRGGVIIHEDGVTFGQALGTTSVLIKAPGAEGVNATSQSGVQTDSRGYAIVPYATPYREYAVGLDTQSLKDNTDLVKARQTVIPTRGAIARADFDVKVGYRTLFTLQHTGGEAIPFGATASLEGSNESMGIVADNGQVYLSGVPLTGRIQVKWGSAASQQCAADFTLPEDAGTHSGGVVLLALNCQ